MIEKLRNNICEVRFTKVNGAERIMKCTLMESYLPAKEEKIENRKGISSNTISVWSIEDNSWRSFRRDSVISLDIIE